MIPKGGTLDHTIRISGYPVSDFFRIFSLYGHNIDHRLMKLDMNDLQGGTEDFHYSDIRISAFGFFRIFLLFDLVI